MKRFSLDFVVGVFVLIGICCLVFLALKVADPASFKSQAKSNYTVYAHFNNIGALQVSAPVRVSGFTVGRVTNIYLDKDTYQAVVVMSIDNQYKFSTDTAAQILTVGLLGSQYIALQSGADSSYLKNGDTISITSSAMVLENLIGKFMTNVSGGKQ